MLILAPVAGAGDAWTDPANPIRTVFRGERLDLWSLQPIRDVAVPPVNRPDRVSQPVDAFILEKLQAAGLEPAPEADRRTLARRLAYTLTGLPPDPDVLETFCQDSSPDAWERLVDSLLASPEFGVHWASMWLDTVRYSDSNGYDWDEFRRLAWRYRDYVVRSFQQDKPFDRFIREQLAGDEMVDGPPLTEDERDCLIATGYLRMGPQDNSAKLFGEENRERAAFEADMVETTGTAFLGMTLRCCRCHDHKTDPLTQDDHYRLRAFFSGVEREDNLPIDLRPDHEETVRRRQEADARIGDLRRELDSVLDAAKARLTADAGGEKEPDGKKIRKWLTATEKAIVEGIEERISRLESAKPAITVALGVREDRGKPAAIPVLGNGEAGQPRHLVEPGIFTVFGGGYPVPPADRASGSPDPAPDSSRPRRSRLDLANWIVSPDNPLTARVIVNRIWQQCFGEGLVATPDDFGFTGAGPTHPELLDWLATRFRSDGWSVKRLVRMLVTSSTWRQTAWVTDPAALARGMDTDAANSLLWRANPRRLTAEELRDSLLKIAGQLTRSPYGPPVWPELPADVLQANPAFLDDNAERTKGWYPDAPENLHVRSIRLIRKRSVKIPFMETFDLPDNFEACTGRLVSTGAPQALTLLNHPLSREVADTAAARIRESAGDDPAEQIRHAFRLILQRDPLPEETDACLPLVRDRSLAELCRVLFNTNEFLVVD